MKYRISAAQIKKEDGRRGRKFRNGELSLGEVSRGNVVVGNVKVGNDVAVRICHKNFSLGPKIFPFLGGVGIELAVSIPLPVYSAVI